MRPRGTQGLWDPVLWRAWGCAQGKAGGFSLCEGMSAAAALSLVVCGHPGLCRAD